MGVGTRPTAGRALALAPAWPLPMCPLPLLWALFADGHKYRHTEHGLPKFYLQNTCKFAVKSALARRPGARRLPGSRQELLRLHPRFSTKRRPLRPTAPVAGLGYAPCPRAPLTRSSLSQTRISEGFDEARCILQVFSLLVPSWGLALPHFRQVPWGEVDVDPNVV